MIVLSTSRSSPDAESSLPCNSCLLYTSDQGLLVPDELVVDLVVDRVNQEDCKNGYVLDGFPRTIPQAEALDKALAELGQKMDYAIDVDVPDENIIHRMGGRRACVGCGATYHLEYACLLYTSRCV